MGGEFAVDDLLGSGGGADGLRYLLGGRTMKRRYCATDRALLGCVWFVLDTEKPDPNRPSEYDIVSYHGTRKDARDKARELNEAVSSDKANSQKPDCPAAP